MRRLLEEKNYFCKCGHVKRRHEGDDYGEWCAEYYTPKGPCRCPKFEIDNLHYLEAKAKEKDRERTKI